MERVMRVSRYAGPSGERRARRRRREQARRASNKAAAPLAIADSRSVLEACALDGLDAQVHGEAFQQSIHTRFTAECSEGLVGVLYPVEECL